MSIKITKHTREIREYGPEITYRAYNGHMMTALQYRYGDGPWIKEQYSAWHADECHCEDGGASIPDW